MEENGACGTVDGTQSSGSPHQMGRMNGHAKPAAVFVGRRRDCTTSMISLLGCVWYIQRL